MSDPLEPVVQGRSLWGDAFRRLRKNRMATLGVIYVILVGLASTFANILAPFDPQAQELWVGVRGPFYTHPTVADLMDWEVGGMAPKPFGTLQPTPKKIVLFTERMGGDEYRVVVRSGVVSRISKDSGELVEDLGVGPEYFFRVRNTETKQWDKVPYETWEISVGNKLPEFLAKPDAQGPYVQQFLVGKKEELGADRIEAGLAENGRVTTLIREGGSVQTLEVRGDEVVQAEVDGLPFQHTHPLGTDDLGRDTLSRVLYGGRISLMVGIVATLVSLLIGVAYGASSGYYGNEPFDVLRLVSIALVIGVLVGALSISLNQSLWTVIGNCLLAMGLIFVIGKINGGIRKVDKDTVPGRVLFFRLSSIDNVMMRTVDILYALPYMFLVIILLVLFGRSLIILFVALGAVQWLTMARIVRGQVLSLKEMEFVEAAVCIGTTGPNIISRHLIPNVLGTVIVYTTLTVPAVILQEAFLAFLGLSVQFQGQALESWGSLTKTGLNLALSGQISLLVFSAFILSSTLFALNFIGDGVRDALDPQQKGKS